VIRARMHFIAFWILAAILFVAALRKLLLFPSL